MDVGLKLWILLLGGVVLLGGIWLLWSRFVGLPTHDPTSSPSQLGDPTVNDAHRRDDQPHG